MDPQMSTHRIHRSIHWHQIVVTILVLSLVTAAILLQHQHAYGATIVVDTFADDDTVNGNCTLREAVISANSDYGADNCIPGSGADTISLPKGFFYLSLGEIALSTEMEIVGQGMDLSVIDGSLGNRIFKRSGAAADVSIRNLTLRNTRESGQGGGALNQGSFYSTTFENVRITNHTTDHWGGAIYSQGTITLIDCVVSNNFARDNTAFNSGGAIRSTGELTVVRTTFLDNGLDASASPGQGGAIRQDLDLLIVEDSTFDGNEAANGGAIHALGEVHITGTTFYDNDATSAGGAINSGPSGNLYITNSTFSANDGGDLRYSGDAWIQNSTFFDYYLTDVTFTSGGGTLTIKNSILFSNYGANCSVPILSAGYNLANDTSCSLSGTGDLSGVDPKLDFWAYNGGPTWTHALKPGSPAIDAGNPAGCTDDVGDPILTDQRGFPRAIDGNIDGSARCDIGAYEAEPFMLFLPLIMH
jgi:CSLREA domain-containing protein